MASKLEEQRVFMVALSQGEAILENDEQYAFAAGQVIYYLLHKSKTADKVINGWSLFCSRCTPLNWIKRLPGFSIPISMRIFQAISVIRLHRLWPIRPKRICGTTCPWCWPGFFRIICFLALINQKKQMKKTNLK